MSLSAVDLLSSFWGVEYSFMMEFMRSMLWLFMLPGRDLPSTVTLISPSSFMSALTSVLMDRLLRLSTSFLYLLNLSISGRLLVPAVEELVGFLYFQLVLDEAVHPQDMVVLSFEFELVADEEAQFLLGLVLEFAEGFLEECVELFLDVRGLGVDFFDLEVDLAQVVGQLVLPPLDVRVDLLHLRRNLGVGFFQLNQRVLRHLPAHVVPEDLAVHAQRLAAGAAVELELVRLVDVALSELFGFFRDVNSDVLRSQFGHVVVFIALCAEMCVFGDAVEGGGFWWYFGAIFAQRRLRLLFLIGVDDVVDDVDGQYLVVLEHDVLMFEHLRVFFLVVQINGLEAFGAGDGLIDELVLAVAVGLAH